MLDTDLVRARCLSSESSRASTACLRENRTIAMGSTKLAGLAGHWIETAIVFDRIAAAGFETLHFAT